MTTEQTRKTVQHYLEALVSSGDFARYLADDVMLTFEGTDRTVQGREPVRQLISAVHEQAFRSTMEIKHLVCDGSRAMIEADFAGTHVGDFEGIPATHRSVRLPYAVAYDVNNNLIRELRLYFPLDALVNQLTAPASHRASA